MYFNFDISISTTIEKISEEDNKTKAVVSAVKLDGIVIVSALANELKRLIIKIDKYLLIFFIINLYPSKV